MMRTLAPALLLMVVACCGNRMDHEQRARDEKTIAALKANGSDLSKPHLLEHHVYAWSPEDAEALAAWGRANGFTVTEFVPGTQNGRKYTRFDLVKPTVPDIETVSADTQRLLRVAREHHADYDGWGCPIVR